MKKQELYYRPEWTCGRYDRENKAAIMYNLIEGMSFYYEDITAEVIGCILSVERNHSFDLPWLSRKSDVKGRKPRSIRTATDTVWPSHSKDSLTGRDNRFIPELRWQVYIVV